MPVVPRTGGEDRAPDASRRGRRVRRVRLNAIAWLVGSCLLAALWASNQWHANGAFRHFGSHAGNRGDWNPTLLALAVGLWGLVVGIMALGLLFERGEVGGRLKFHVAAWALAMIVLTPLWALLSRDLRRPRLHG